MTLTVAWWLHERVPDHPVADVISGVPLLHVALAPYDAFTRGATAASRYNRYFHNYIVATNQHKYIVQHGMKVSRSSARHFAAAGVGRSLKAVGHYRLLGKLGARLIPGLGWALLAYDVYTVTNMILDD